MSQKKRNQKRNSKWLIAEAAAVAVIGFGIWGYSMVRSAGAYVNEQDAIRINGEKYSVSDVNYFYYTFYNSFREQNAEYISYMIDDSKPLKDQEYEDGQSWFSYLLDESVQSMINVVTLSEAAAEDGFELDETSREEIRDYLDGVTAVAENNDLSADAYMRQIYGQDMTLERYEELMTMSFTAREYSLNKQESLEISEEDIQQEFEENRQDYEFVSYERLYFKAAGAEEEATEEQLSKAKAQASEALERVRAGEDLKTLSEEYEGSVYYASDEAYYSSGYAYGDWLFSDERKAGDSEMLEDEKGCYVMVFREKFRHEYPTVNIRDIHFAVDTSAEDLDEEYEASCADAEAVLEEWKSGDQTEEQFEALAKEHASGQTEEPGSLYENVQKGELDSYVEKWCFDEARRPGDCEVIYADNGFHILYFVGFGDSAWKIEAEENLRDEALQDMVSDLLNEAEVEQNEEALEKAASTLN